MFELQTITALTNAPADYDFTDFDEICRFFEDNNKGLESPWSWEDAFNLKTASFNLLWNNKISHIQHRRLWDAVSVPLF